MTAEPSIHDFLEVKILLQLPRGLHHHPLSSPYQAQVVVSEIYTRMPFTIMVSTNSTKGATSISFYKQCLEICDRTHTKCRVKRVNQLPTRLLHIISNPGGTDDTPSVRLVLTGPEFSKDTKFAALSYCWGEGHGLRLEESNYQSLMKHIPFNELPATIQDSIMVTIELGMQYLWVDALCIIQNQDSNKDWSYEAGKMCDIYQGCAVAIAASGASNSTEGLFAVRDPLRQAECAIGTSLITVTLDSDRDQSYWALETRGWALQEEILPARSIRFGSYVRWNCRELSVNEFGHFERDTRGESAFSQDFFSRIIESPTVNPIDQIDEGETYKLWQRIIYRYTRTKLSYQSDKLAAIEGLRSAFQQRTGWAYACGLCQSFIMQELLWRRDVYASAAHAARSNRMRPSWSWVSMDGALILNRDSQAELMEVAKFVGVSSSSSGCVDFDSPVELELSGMLFQIREPHAGFQGHPRIQCLPVLGKGRLGWATVYETYDDRSRLWRKGDMALPLQYNHDSGEVFGLIVISFTGSEAFERVGYFRLRDRYGRPEKEQMAHLARSLDRSEEEPFIRRKIQLV